MSAIWVDLTGPVLADSVYSQGRLVARDVKITLPAVTPKTSTYQAMGDVELPMAGQLEAMEASVTKIGVDFGLRSMVGLESIDLEFRWAQDVVDQSGDFRHVGCKAFLRCISKGIPGIGLEVASHSENDMTFAVTRYQLFIGNDEYCLIDPLNMIQRIDGKDYAEPIASLL